MNDEDELRDLLSQLPQKRQVQFALDCALDIKHLIDRPTSLKALELTALWLEDKATTQEVLDITYIIADSSSDLVTHAVVAISDSVAPTSLDAVLAAITFISAQLNLPLEHYYTKLLNSLSEVEKAIYEL